jgi:multidrug efflux pump subunit AcrB
METLKKSFPPGWTRDRLRPDAVRRQSIEIVHAAGSRALVVLRDPVPADWRASVIPLVAVPVSIIGTSAVL